jgi:hypothetical protein
VLYHLEDLTVTRLLFLSRPFELIAVASGKSVSIWRLEFPLDSQGRLVVTRSARLTDHNGEVRPSTLDAYHDKHNGRDVC